MSNDTETLTLSNFLLARIADDEAYVQQMFMDYAPSRLREWSSPWTGAVDTDADEVLICNDGPLACHIARHDPARVLAECTAKRRIVEASRSEAIDAAFYAVPELPADDDWAHGAEWAFGLALRALAQPYADHPDFREEWRE